MSDHSASNSTMPARTAFFVRLAAGLLVTTTLIVATGFYMKTRSGPVAQNDNVDPVAAPLPSNQEPISAAPAAEPKIGGEPLFARWPKDKPDVVIVFTGQTKGYLQPCGCSKPQLGGLERRFNFVESLKAKGWPVVGLDLGDMTAPNDPNGQRTVLDQTYKKYEYNMKALKEMDYAAVGVGEHDFSAQLIQLLGRFTLSNDGKPPYLLAGNLVGGVERDAQGKPIKYESREKYFNAGEGKRPMIEAYEIITKAKAVPIGVVGTVGPSVAKKVVQVDKELDFGLNSDLLKSALKAMNASPNKPELKVLLYQGTPDEAKAIAEDFSEFQVIVCLSEEAEPPSAPIELLNQKTQAKTLILQLGHKGRYVGVLGAFKTKDGLELKYQLVPLGEEYLTPETPEAEKNNKVLQLLESYAADVKREDLLSLYTKNRPQHALQIEHAKEHEITYVGSEACMKCHAAEYAVWKNTKHAKAYEALEKLAKRPSMQQFNGECVTCHTTGFNYKSGFENKEKTPLLVHNGCENCHGPGSAHAKDPKNKTFVAATIPWRFTDKDKLPSKEFMDKMGKLDGIARGKIEVDARTQRVVNEISRMCVKCHDSENDPKFDFYKYMPQIYHSGLKNQGLPTGIGK